MNLEALIATYGYPAVLVGTFFEGETVLIAAGFLAHGGHLDLRWVTVAAFIGSMAGDQTYFHLGRLHGRDFVARRGWTAAANRLEAALTRRGGWFVAGFRFLYGLRMASPIVIGMVGYPVLRFTILNLCGALAWSVVMAGAGYLFGQTVQVVMADARRYEGWLVAAVVLAGTIAALLIRRRRARARDQV